MTGAPPLADVEAALAARVGGIPADDPLYAVAQALLVSVRTYGQAIAHLEAMTARPPQALTLTAAQLDPLTAAVENAAACGVRQAASRIAGWRAVFGGGLVALAALGAGVAVHAWDKAQVIATQSALGALPAAVAAEWAHLAALNPSPKKLAARPERVDDGSTAAWLLMRTAPPSPAPPQAGP
ncbi:hypothetical protein [Rhodovastum atsumiense]|uniref:Uncharacterized protein n=1 Tax=Rhodovastum atsumiense TaxID=504468 RepID=A0A5M6IMX6_9PROT|nr:hypothetical protein [Rhodovastum atsumiense]KAA5609606.1 hypothetical protein F1189_23565 [Rhodovastum atsumiense]